MVTQISVTVGPPELKATAASKHHEYRVSGTDGLGEFDTMRRYSDFLILKQHLQAKWPGLYIPSLPEKKFLGNNELLFLEVRRAGLENFVRYLADQRHLWYGDVLVHDYAGVPTFHQEQVQRSRQVPQQPR